MKVVFSRTPFRPGSRGSLTKLFLVLLSCDRVDHRLSFLMISRHVCFFLAGPPFRLFFLPDEDGFGSFVPSTLLTVVSHLL